MSLQVQSEHWVAIQQHGETAFPHECCGILIGRQQGEHKVIHELWQVSNTWDSGENLLADGESSRRRFLIDPLDFKKAHDHAHKLGLGILGTYHSHPNHPAIPSEFDRQHAFPWGFSCLIVSVYGGEAGEIKSWILDQDDQPIEEALTVNSGSSSPELALAH